MGDFLAPGGTHSAGGFWLLAGTDFSLRGI
jgi:hypothetical protein